MLAVSDVAVVGSTAVAPSSIAEAVDGSPVVLRTLLASAIDGSWLVALALLAVAIAAIGWLIRRDRVLFRVVALRGRISLVQGRIPQALLSELRDVLGRPRASCTVVGYRSGDRVGVRVTGEAVDAAVVQRARNVVGRFTLGQIATAPRRRS